jgi:ethanolamine utilization protein EutJ
LALDNCNLLIKRFEETIANPVKQSAGARLFTGVDLGTAYIVLAVVDGQGQPVAGAMRFAQVVKDGLVVDYMRAVEIVRELKNELESKLGVELSAAATAYPPGTGGADTRAIRYVAQSAGFDVLGSTDEPTAANAVLGITDGAVVDIGGGTTGVAVFRQGEVVYVADEPTGGTQFSLVIAGALKIHFEEAEALKIDPDQEDRLQPLIKPVMEKVASIIQTHVAGYPVETVYLVGGTSCNKYIGGVIAQETGLTVVKPCNPFLVTPLGIALHAVASQTDAD